MKVNYSVIIMVTSLMAYQNFAYSSNISANEFIRLSCPVNKNENIQKQCVAATIQKMKSAKYGLSINQHNINSDTSDSNLATLSEPIITVNSRRDYQGPFKNTLYATDEIYNDNQFFASIK